MGGGTDAPALRLNAADAGRGPPTDVARDVLPVHATVVFTIVSLISADAPVSAMLKRAPAFATGQSFISRDVGYGPFANDADAIMRPSRTARCPPARRSGVHL